MANEQLLNYIKQARQSSKNDEQIRQELLNTGWQGGDIDEALKIKPSAGKAWGFLILVLTVLGIAVAGYFASAYYFTLWPFEILAPITTLTPRPSSALNPILPNQLEGWKTYRNDQYGFEFKYPSQWTEKDGHIDILKNGTTEVEGQLMVSVGKNKNEGAESGGFLLEDSVSKFGFTVEAGYNFFGLNFYKLAVREKNGNWIQILLTNYSSSKFYHGDQDKVTSFYKNNNDPEILRHFSYFDQILSTFKFAQ